MPWETSEVLQVVGTVGRESRGGPLNINEQLTQAGAFGWSPGRLLVGLWCQAPSVWQGAVSCVFTGLAGSLASSYKGSNPINGGSTLTTKDLPVAPPPNAVMLGLGFQHAPNPRNLCPHMQNTFTSSQQPHVQVRRTSTLKPKARSLVSPPLT